MKVRLKIAGHENDTVPLEAAASAIARAKATVRKLVSDANTSGRMRMTDPVVDPSIRRICEAQACRLLLDEALEGRLRVCDSAGMVSTVADLVDTAAREGLVRYKALDEAAHEVMLANTVELEPGCGVTVYSGPPIAHEQDLIATHLAALHTTPEWLAAWGRNRGIDIKVEFSGAVMTTDKGWGGVPGSTDEQPAQLETKVQLRHRIAPHDLLAPLIGRICRDLGTFATAEVMAELERLARLPESGRPPPLTGVNSGAVKWISGGQVVNLTRKALGDRLRRLAKAREAAQSRAEPRG